MASTPDIATLARRVRDGDRAMLARAITLIESKRADHQNRAHQLVQELLPQTGKAIRVGITGAPGVGKSLTIDTLGTHLTGQGHKVAVLAVDPSSTAKKAQKTVENPPDETISRNPRNHPETDGAYISPHQMAHRRLGGIT